MAPISEQRAASVTPDRRHRRASVLFGVLAAVLVGTPVSAADHVRPKVVSMVPGQGSLRAQPWTSIVVRLSEPIKSAAGATLNPIGDATPVAAVVSLSKDGRRLTIDPADDLDIGLRYRVRLPGTIRDRRGQRPRPVDRDILRHDRARRPSRTGLQLPHGPARLGLACPAGRAAAGRDDGRHDRHQEVPGW